MELNEINKAIADFEAKLKPIKEGQTTLTQEEVIPGVASPEEAIATPEEVVGQEGFCLTPAFKQLVIALANSPTNYIGDNIDSWLMDLLGQPDCAEVT